MSSDLFNDPKTLLNSNYLWYFCCPLPHTETHTERAFDEIRSNINQLSVRKLQNRGVEQ